MIRLLSPLAIREIAPGDVLNCSVINGLSLVGRENGQHTWELFYRTKTNVRRRPTIGKWPTLNIEGARRAARTIMERVAAGEDPGSEIAAARAAATVNDLCDAYSAWAIVHKASSSLRTDEHMIAKWVRPALGKHRINDVTSNMIDALLNDVYRGHHKSQNAASVRPGEPRPVQSNRVRMLLSKMFSLARDRFEMTTRDRNPVQGTKMHVEHLRKVVATPEQLSRLGAAAHRLGETEPAKGAFLILLLTTGARVGEIHKLRSHQIVGKTIVLREHKTVAKTGEKTIALPPPAVAALTHLVPDKQGYLFRAINTQSLWKIVRRMADVGDLRLQDARRTFASTALNAGYSLSQIGQQLGHTSPLTTQRYSWLASDKKAEIAQVAGGQIAALLTQGQDDEPRDASDGEATGA